MSEIADTAPGPAGPAAEGSQSAAPAAKGLYFVRRVTAMQDFELFFVTSIATILLVRSILAATGWPQLGGGKIGWFIITSVLSLLGIFALDSTPGQLNLMDMGSVFANMLTGALVVVGIVVWRRSRLSAFRWFERGCLVAIFGLLWLLLQLAVIRSMVSAGLATTAIRLQDTSSGGAHAAHQV